jgi:hypothetical protein
MQFKLEKQLKSRAITDTFNISQTNKAAIRSHYIAIKSVCNRLIATLVFDGFMDNSTIILF